MKQFCLQHTKITVKFHEQLQHDLISDVLHDKLDAVICYDLALRRYPFDTTVLQQPRPYAIVLAAPPLSKHKTVSLHALSGEGFVLFDVPDSRKYFDSNFTDLSYQQTSAFA